MKRALLVLLALMQLHAVENVGTQVRNLARAARAGDDQGIDKLGHGLGAMDAQVRAAAITGLSQSWPAGAQYLHEVRRSLDDLDPPVRQAALNYAGRVNDDTAIPAALRALREQDPATVQAAHQTLIALARADKGPDVAVWEAWAAEREKVVEPILERTQSAISRKDDRAIIEGIHAMLFLRDRPATVGRILLGMLDNPNPEVAQLVRGAIGQIDRPEIVAALARDPHLADQVAEAPTPMLIPQAASALASAKPGQQAVAAKPEGGSGLGLVLAVVLTTIVGIAVFLRFRKGTPAAPAAATDPKRRVTFTS